MRIPGVLALLLLLAASACGQKIGDACAVSSDCSTDASRVCDTFSPGGYCTIAGCDFGTCPDESICVRFFPALESAAECGPGLPDCAVDEICTVAGQCAPRSIELRFCMLTCGGDGDCRPEYECRTRELMQMHGGEPVPDPSSDGTPPDRSFCASRRPCVTNDDCEGGDLCDRATRVCLPT
jgi:hypothetical protein